MLRYVDSQEEFSQYNNYLGKHSPNWTEYYWNSRKVLFMARIWMYYALFQFHFRFGYDFKFWLPGLEMKFACEAAERNNARLHFLGAELDPTTWSRLNHETRMNIPQYLLRRI